MLPIKLWYRQMYAYPSLFHLSEVEEVMEYTMSADNRACALIVLKARKGGSLHSPILVPLFNLMIGTMRDVLADCQSVL